MADDDTAKRDSLKKLFKESFDEWYTDKEKAKKDAEEKTRTDSKDKPQGFLGILGF